MKFDAGMWILTLRRRRLLTTRFVLMALRSPVDPPHIPASCRWKRSTTNLQLRSRPVCRHQCTPIQCVTKTGLKPTEKEIEFDIVVYATGFDGITTGAFDRIDIRGIGGVALADKWKDGPTTFIRIIG